MSHHIYTMEAFVIESSDSGESGKFIKFFTRDLGLIGAKAEGVKNLKSKLRFGLEDYSLSLVSFVRGKTGWRVTGALPLKNLHSSLKENKEKFLVCAETLRLIKKLVVGEERNEELFSIIFSAFDFLEREDLDREALGNFECLLILRIVCNLGYLAHTKGTESFARTADWNFDVIRKVAPIKKEAVKLINQSFVESGL